MHGYTPSSLSLIYFSILSKNLPFHKVEQRNVTIAVIPNNVLLHLNIYRRLSSIFSPLTLTTALIFSVLFYWWENQSSKYFYDVSTVTQIWIGDLVLNIPVPKFQYQFYVAYGTSFSILLISMSLCSCI